MAQKLNEIQLRGLIKKMIEEQNKPKETPKPNATPKKTRTTSKVVKEQLPDTPKAEGPQSWFSVVNITRILQNKLGRELANNKDVRAELSGVLAELIKKRYTYPEVQALMSFIEKYK
jgi:hypothetical protein